MLRQEWAVGAVAMQIDGTKVVEQGLGGGEAPMIEALSRLSP